LRAGQKAAWGAIPCHGDVFHGERELGQLASYLRGCEEIGFRRGISGQGRWSALKGRP
jgi:hypothetical protein